MKNLLFITITLFGLNCFSQGYNDLIVTTNDSIHCQITMVNEHNVFYKYLKKRSIESGMIGITNIVSYTQKGVTIKPTDLEVSKEDSIKYSGERYVYCRLVGLGKLFSTKVTVSIDYGESKGYWEDRRIKDERSGRVKVFNSMIDGMNYMGSKGWEFVQAYVISSSLGLSYHYILKKKLD